jgi:hypothetical protein
VNPWYSDSPPPSLIFVPKINNDAVPWVFQFDKSRVAFSLLLLAVVLAWHTATGDNCNDCGYEGIPGNEAADRAAEGEPAAEERTVKLASAAKATIRKQTFKACGVCICVVCICDILCTWCAHLLQCGKSLLVSSLLCCASVLRTCSVFEFVTFFL